MSRTLVQFSLLTMFVFASMTGAFAQSSANHQPGAVIGNNASNGMTAIKEPLSEPVLGTARVVTQAYSQHPTVRVAVMGQVWTPGVYEFRRGAPHLKELIENSGGLKGYCAHEFYIFKTDEAGIKLERDQYEVYEFEDGDVLLAETAARHYKALGTPDKQHTLSEIHPQTQIVLLNVLDRPVLLSLPPEQATLAHVLSKLSPNPTSLVGHVENIPPPNAGAIPPNALIVPNMIFSGSIFLFEPGVIDRTLLPTFQRPILAKLSPNVEVLAEQKEASESGWAREQGTLMVQPVKSKTHTAFNPESETPSSTDSPEETEKSNTPFDEMLAQIEQSSGEVLHSDAPSVLLPDDETKAERALLSAQQWRIIVTFVTLMVLFLSAWYIRQRQQKNGIKTYNFIESRIGTSAVTETVPVAEAKTSRKPDEPLPAEAAIEELQKATAVGDAVEPAAESPEPAAQSRNDGRHDDVLEIESLTSEEREESVARHSLPVESIELSAYDSDRNEDFIDEKIYDVTIEELGSSHEIVAFDPVEWPLETAESLRSMIEGHTDETADEDSAPVEKHHGSENSEHEPATRVQQSLLGTPWLQELSDGLDPHESDISLHEQPVEAPEAGEEIKEARPQQTQPLTSGRFAAQQLRIDQAHTQPLQPAARPHVPKAAPEQASEPGKSESDHVKPPSAASKWLRIEDAPRQPEETLDHIFQSILRDRQKD